MTNETILEEACRVTSEDRNQDYGPPLDDYMRTAALWTALLSHKLKPGETIEWDDAIRCMCAMKLSRDVNRRNRDNMVDLAGYAQCRQLADDEEVMRLDDGRHILDDPP